MISLRLSAVAVLAASLSLTLGLGTPVCRAATTLGSSASVSAGTACLVYDAGTGILSVATSGYTLGALAINSVGDNLIPGNWLPGGWTISPSNTAAKANWFSATTGVVGFYGLPPIGGGGTVSNSESLGALLPPGLPASAILSDLTIQYYTSSSLSEYYGQLIYQAANNNFTWLGSSDSNWSNASNWSPANAPGGPGQTIAVGGPGANSLLDLATPGTQVVGNVTFSANVPTTIVNSGGGQLEFNGGTAVSYVNVLGNHSISSGLLLDNNLNVFLLTSTSSLTISGVIADSGGYPDVSINGSGTLILTAANTTSGDMYVNGGVLQLGNNTATGSLNVGSNLYLSGSNSTLAFHRRNTATQGIDFTSYPITGPGALLQMGPGTLVLNAANTYTGGTNITGGVLMTSAPGALPSTSRLTVSGGGVLDLDGQNQSVASITLGDGGIQSSNSPAALTVTGATAALTYTGTGSSGSTISGGTLDLAPPGAASTQHFFAVNLDAGQQPGVVGVNIFSTIADGSANSQSIVKTGAGGILELSGANTYSGTTTIASGILQANNASALGNGGNITFSGGTLQIVSPAAATQDWGARIKSSTASIRLDPHGNILTWYGGIDSTNTAGLTVISSTNAASTLILAGSNNYSGTTTFGGTGNVTLQLGNGGATGSLSTSSPIAFGNTYQLAPTLAFSRNNTITQGTDFSGSGITGAGNVNQLGPGLLVLTASNSYTGNTTISGGSVQLNNANAVAASTVVDYVASNGLVFNGGIGSFTAGGLAGTGSFALADTAGNSVALSVGGNSPSAFSGTMSGSGSLAKINGGTLILSGSNSFTGNTSIFQGTLQLGSGGTTGSLATLSAVSFTGGTAATLAFNRDNTVNQGIDFSGGAIAGPGNLSQEGPGAVVLTANNTYTGGTTISGGTLVVANSAGSATGPGTVTLSGGVLASGPTGAIGGTVVTGANSSYQIAPGDFSSIGTLSVAGSVNLKNNNTTLDFYLSGGGNSSLSINGPLAISGSATVNFTTNGALANSYTLANFASTNANLGDFSVTNMPAGYSLVLDPTDLRLLETGPATAAWRAAVDGNWSNGANWTTGASPNGAGQTAVLNASTTAAVTVTLDIPETIGTLEFGNSGGNLGLGYTVSGTDALTLNNSNSAAVLSVSEGQHAIATPVLLTSDLVVSPSAGSQLEISGDVQQSTPGLSLALDNLGTLILSGSNDYTGGTTVAKGSLLLDSGQALGNGPLIIGAGGTMLFDGSGGGAGTPVSAGVVAVPEPATGGLLAVVLLAGLITISRHRRPRWDKSGGGVWLSRGSLGTDWLLAGRSWSGSPTGACPIGQLVLLGRHRKHAAGRRRQRRLDFAQCLASRFTDGNAGELERR